MKGYVLTLFALVAVISAVGVPPKWSELDNTYEFDHYVQHFDKAYTHDLERDQRERIFNERLNMIMAHNEGTATWKMGVNQFTDRTEEELSQYLGLHKGMLFSKRGFQEELEGFENIDVDTLPTSVDWRGKGVLTSVKDQGKCGSCWAFAATEGIESMWAITTGQLITLSEQNVLDCTPNPNHCGGTGGCGGGIAELAFDVVKEKGIASEWTYPYISYNGKDYNCSTGATPAAHITGYVNLPVNQMAPFMKALADVGPLVISVDASKWFLYESGVFDGCNQKNPDLDHLVQAVGYGTDEKLGDYWIIRNSWSPTWGERGFIRLRRTSIPRCGIDTTPEDGNGCDGGPPEVNVCGTCGVLYDALYPTYEK